MNKQFKGTHQAGFRLLKVVHKMDRNLLPQTVLRSILQAVLPYISIILSARVIDCLLEKRFEDALFFAIVMVSLTLAGEVVSSILQYFSSISRNMLQDRLEVVIREKAMDLDYQTMENPKVYEALRNAESAAQFNGGLGKLVSLYGDLLQYLLGTVTAVVLTVMFCLSCPVSGNGTLKLFSNPALTSLCLVLAWLLGIFLSRKANAKIKEIDDNIADKHYVVENQLSYWIFQVLQNVESGMTIRVNGMADLLHQRITGFENKMNPLFKSMCDVEQMKMAQEGVQSGIFMMAAYFFVLCKIVTKAITVGSFTQYTGALLQFNQATSKLVWSESEVERLTRNLEPLADFLDRTNQMETGSLNIEKRTDHRYEIEFHDVGFRYPGSEEFSLRHINCKILLKQKMAVVGPNGAGKSTFIKLLCRLYDPTEGEITLNGIDIRKYNYHEYLSLFGVVFQNFHLFGFGVDVNVAASEELQMDKVMKCLEESGVADFVKTLPNGVGTVIEKGEEDSVNLSGGQEQKIAIARALYKDAPFVILDEPTAALDPISESEIYERFHSMVLDKTAVYISHRMSSCRFCDVIYVFDQGQIVEQGSHEALLSQSGLYASLWNAQAKYYVQKVQAPAIS